MSRDGYLPPGCTEKDVDMATPGYYDEQPDPVEEAMNHQAQQQEEYERLEALNLLRRHFAKDGYKLMDEDRTWFKWQLAVWAEQIK